MSKYLEQAKKLVSEMTLEEKVSQMLHRSPSVERLNIPSYNWWNEALHGVARSGVATVFPQAIGLAATFDPDLVFKVAEIIAVEARAKYNAYQEEGDHDIYKGLTFWSPSINIFRDPRWGRGQETYGEDPWLTAKMGVSFIKGLQGEDRENLKTAACAKHFAVHSGPESERHSFNAVCSKYDFWNTYMPAFEAAVKEADVESVMGAYNCTFGEPCCGSKFLLQDILKEKWGFSGHIVSDCWAIKDFYESHNVTKNAVESVALAVDNGCDLNCGNLFHYCIQAVREGMLEEEKIDQAVVRLFVTRMRLGILGETSNNKYDNIPYSVVDCSEHRAFNLAVARRSQVLLKNDGVLPIDLSAIKTIGVVGPNADSKRSLEGNYEGTPSEYCTILRGIRKKAWASDVRVMYAQGCHLYNDRVSKLALEDDRIAEAMSVVKNSDISIVCLGLDADIEGEQGDTSNEFTAGDKPDIYLPGNQLKLLEKIISAANGKPVIVVLLGGSALSLNGLEEKSNAQLHAFYPGALGGYAVADILFGDYNPEGKLPVTFYNSNDDLPDFCDYSMENRTYRYFKAKPIYPFGYGLSYGKMELSEFEYRNETCFVRVKNTGEIQCAQVLQVYISGEKMKENFELRGVKRVELNPGEETVAEINIDSSAFSKYNEDGDLVKIPGKFKIHVGFSQPDERSIELLGFAPKCIEIEA